MPPSPHHHAAQALVTLALLAAIIAGCRDDARTPTPHATGSAAPTTTTEHALRRGPLPLQLLSNVTWIRGGSETDTILGEPLAAVADADHVYVLDAAPRRVVALRAADGRLAWTTNDSLHPTAISAALGSGLVVADTEHGAIATLGRDGRVLRTTPLPLGVSTVRSLCTLPDSSFLLAGADPAGMLLQIAPHGREQRRVPLPWPDLAARPPLATQTWLAAPADRNHPCAVALVLGRGFALYDGARFISHHAYVEAFDLPAVKTAVQRHDSATTVTRQSIATDRVAAHDVAAGGGQLVVAFEGESEHRARLLDFYDLRTGRYLHTRLFPRRVSAVATNGRTVFVLFSRAGRAALAALRLDADSASQHSPTRPLTSR